MANNAIQLSGPALMLGAVLLGVAIVWVSFNAAANQVFSPGVSALFLLACILLLVALPGMYARQANAAGWLGLAGYVLLQAGLLLIVMISAGPLLYPGFKQPAGESVPAFSLGIALTAGLLLTGLATLQAGVFPRWAGILMLAATAGFFFSFFVAEFLPRQIGQVGSALLGAVLALSLVWIGWSLWRGPLP